MEIASEEELKELKEIAVVLDVRNPQEIISSGVKVEGSVNIPFNENFLANVEEQIDKNNIIICHCVRGMRAENAKKLLLSAGYTRVLNGENAMRINQSFTN